MVEEVLFSLGPLLTGLAIAVASPGYAAVGGLVLLTAGALLLVANPASAERPPADPAERDAESAAGPGVESEPWTVAPTPVLLSTADPAVATMAAPPRTEVRVRSGLLRRPGLGAMLLTVAGGRRPRPG